MICPKCENEMKKGYVPAGKMALLFIPDDGGKMPITVFGKGKNTIQLTEVPLWKTQKAEAYHCKICKMVIIPVKNIE